jgi:glycosyltransferase involved in cell wall biosynthesis
MNPFFSIIIPAYNREHLIEETIKSVINQSYTNWECVVVDDGSTDNTKNVILSLSENDNRIKYIYQKNAERSAARNNGVKNAIGEYICFLDSDDFYLNNHLENLYDSILINNHRIGLYVTGFTTLSRGIETFPEINLIDDFENITKFVFFSGIIPARVCGNKKIFVEFNFDEDITIVEDTVLWSRITQVYPIFQLEMSSIVYVLHDSNSINLNSKTSMTKLKGLKIMTVRYQSIWNELSRKEKNKIISDAEFKLAQSFLYENNKKYGMFWLLKSLITKLLDLNTKHRIYTITKLCFGINIYINKNLK